MELSRLWNNRATAVVLQSIQWKFVATVLSVAVISIVALTALNIQETQANNRAAAEADLFSGAGLQASTVESSLAEFAGDIRTLAFTPPPAAIQRALANGGVDPKSGDSDTIWKNRLATIFAAMISSKGVYMQIRMLDANGQEILRVDEIDGKPVRLGEEALQDKSGSGYFIAPAKLASGTVFLTALNLNREGGQIQVPHTPVVRLATPIVDASGVLGGVIVTNVFADRLLDRLVGQEGQAIVIVDGDGQLLHAPNPDVTFGLDLETGITLATLHDPQSATELMTGAGVLTVDGQLAAHNTVDFGELVTDNSWSVIVERPESSIPSASLMKPMIVAVILLAVAAAIAYWLARGIAGGVRKMALAAQGIAQGNLEQDISVSSDDEVGDMAVAFAEMLEYLNEMANAANRIAEGDLGTKVTPKSDRDALGNAFVRMQDYISSTAETAEAIASGDLTVDVKPKSKQDVLGNAFSAMVGRLRETMGQVRGTADALANAKDELARSAEQAAIATGEVATTTSQVAEGSSQQATSVQETSRGLAQLDEAATKLQEQAEQEVAEAAERMAANAQEAIDGAAQAEEKATEGAKMVQRTVDGIARIKVSLDSAAEEVAGLGDRSQEIGKIVAVIEDIAAQTNLLALNAAIEAARAGEQGRGFAVVADEVRQLAERVAAATKEIAELIGGVQTGVDGTVKAMQEGAEEMDAGTAAAEAGQALQQILASVSAVTEQIEGLTGGSQELKAVGQEMAGLLADISDGVEQNSAAAEQMQATADTVTQGLSGIASVAEENSAATEQVSASSEHMSAQVSEVATATDALGTLSEELLQQVSQFKIESDGGGEQARRAA